MADHPSGTIGFAELGRTGLQQWGGFIREEFLRELQGRRGMLTFREMSLNDATIGAILFAFKYLTRPVTWRVDPAPGMGTKGEEVAEYIDGALFKDMSWSWWETLNEILSMLVYGWAYFEVVYKRRGGPSRDPHLNSRFTDGKIGWRKWAIRGQDTIVRWELDDHDGIRGMHQQAFPIFQQVFIPIEKALLFRTDTERNNPEGRSILRTAYKSFYYKRRIQEVEGIGIERDLAGLPKITPPEKTDIFNTKDAAMVKLKSEAERLVRSVRRDEQEGLVMPFGWQFELVSTGGARQFDTSKIIDRYDQRIAMSVMADFLLIGHQRVGSFALMSSKTKLFATALGGFLAGIRDVINRHAIPTLVRLNGWHGELAPTLEHGDIETVDLGVLGKYVTDLTGAGLLFPDKDLERHLRAQGNLTPPEESATARPSPPAPGKEPPDPDLEDAE